MISVIGGAGFVGTRLCRLFEAGNKTFAIMDLVNSDEFRDRGIKGDVCCPLDLESISGSDMLINLAGYSMKTKDILKQCDRVVEGAVLMRSLLKKVSHN